MQELTFLFKSPNSTRDLNNHIAKLLAPGPYAGLEIVPTDPPSMATGLTEGRALTDEGVKIVETLPIPSLVTFPASDPNYPRVDLVVMRHRYIAAMTPAPNSATYHVIKGVATPPPGTPMPREVVIDDVTDPLYATSVHPGDIILAEVQIPAGATAISSDYIYNRFRVLTTPEMRLEYAEALYMAFGNFVFEGWDLTTDVLNVIVSPGRGLLCGLPNRTTHDYIITTARAREFLYGPYDDAEPAALYVVGENLTLDKQPDYSSKLRMTVTCPAEVGTTGNIYVTGKNEYGQQINNEAIPITVGAGEAVTVETISRFSEVYHEGIDAHELERAGFTITIYIKDKPINYIYAVGTQAGKAIFKIVMDPAYQPTCDEYLLGWAEADETHLFRLERWATDALALVIEDLSDQCNSVNRIFTLKGLPRSDSEFLIMDGSTLFKNSPYNSGFTLVNNQITLQSEVPTPDGPGSTHGSKPTELWIKYTRQR